MIGKSSDLETSRQFLDLVWIGVEGNMGLYYQKHMIHIGIKKNRKVTEELESIECYSKITQ